VENKSEGTGRIATGTGNQDTGRFAETHLSVFDRKEVLWEYLSIEIAFVKQIYGFV
jgi:hypothetical protein